ncbi:MAG: class II fructose-bisphosphate aldolase [Micrococcales bacterium]|nr:class II fructose-bisphosphate aldolase [Micrococcales bacterium]
MLVNLTDIWAEATGAIACINTPHEDIVRAVVGAAEDLGAPVIIAHAEAHDDAAPLERIGPVMIQAARQASVPVCVHLDHALTRSFVLRGIREGFTSLMWDCSTLPFEENASRLRSLVDAVHPLGITVEGEIGVMPSGAADTHGGGSSAEAFTTPEDAARFADETQVDALAVCFGSAHGIYATTPHLDLDVLRSIRAAVRPETGLVMHGSSGLSDAALRSAADAGCAKINYYTYLATEASDTAAQIVADSPTPVCYHDLAQAVSARMQAHVRHLLSVLA